MINRTSDDRGRRTPGRAADGQRHIRTLAAHDVLVMKKSVSSNQ
jgi:hypothetical protein